MFTSRSSKALLLFVSFMAISIFASSCSNNSTSSENDTANQLTKTQTYDQVRSGARLILSYNAQNNQFTGTVENTTSGTLLRVRVEIHLSNGVELGPTTPTDMAPGSTINITLPVTGGTFTTWSPHSEVG